MKSVLRDLQQQGLSLRGMSAELMKRRIPTPPRGGTRSTPGLLRLVAASGRPV
jgi:hypothetical protein